MTQNNGKSLNFENMVGIKILLIDFFLLRKPYVRKVRNKIKYVLDKINSYELIFYFNLFLIFLCFTFSNLLKLKSKRECLNNNVLLNIFFLEKLKINYIFLPC